jgi:hypothetical protein
MGLKIDLIIVNPNSLEANIIIPALSISVSKFMGNRNDFENWGDE